MLEVHQRAYLPELQLRGDEGNGNATEHGAAHSQAHLCGGDRIKLNECVCSSCELQPLPWAHASGHCNPLLPSCWQPGAPPCKLQAAATQLQLKPARTFILRFFMFQSSYLHKGIGSEQPHASCSRRIAATP